MKPYSSAVYVGKPYLSRNLFSLHDYAQATHLYELLSEATKILLRKSGIGSSQVISQFLQQCNRGEHVLLKSYGSFSKSTLCKICFLYNFIKIFQVDQTQRNGLDYYQLSRLLCSDFPREFIQKAVSLLLPESEPQEQMFKLLPPKKIQQALYLCMIYTEYIDTFSKYFEQEEELDFLEVYRIAAQQDRKNIPEFSKPPFAVVAQCLLNLMREKGLLEEQQVNLIFITEQNMEDFIRDAQTNHPDCKVRVEEILRNVLESREYVSLVEQNLGMFESSQNWIVQSHKILSTRQPVETPLNVKKKGTKK